MSKESKLEAEFESACAEARVEINKHIMAAKKSLEEAEKVAEKYGIPFKASASPIANSYIPKSFEEKFGKLEREFVSEISGVWSDFYAGWEHSAVCY